MSSSDFFYSEFVTLMPWVYVSFLHPSSQDLRVNMPRCPSLSIPSVLFFILPNAHCCYLQSLINITLPMAKTPQIKSGSAPSLWVSKTSFHLRLWDSPGKNTGVCCHFLLWQWGAAGGVFLTQGSNPRLFHFLH